MITDARVLKDEFIPREVVHRDSEIQELADALKPLIEGEHAENSMLFGPPGTGKTCISQHTLEKLSEEHLDLRHHYINCWENYNRFRVLYKALEGLGKTLDVFRRSTPTDELLSRLKEDLERPYVLILDEVDQLEDEEVLYDLYTVPMLTVILIANRETFFHKMDDRIRSRLMSSKRIEFKKYRTEELEDILQDRSEWGLRPDAVDRSVLRKIALSADGDARIAIGILRSAARKAENKDAKKITKDMVQNSLQDAKQDQRQKNLDKLTEHQRLLYEIIEEEGEIEPSELYSRYREEVDEPRSDRMLRKYLNKMVHYNLIDSEGEGRWRVYKSK
ncbi:MAG: Cdc6/Cdc18 family protein [Candidatus Nanohaloarchaea archaeon]|nr:Cdc6/Cdc18 family protein [Candidatus Nanohaloarchaea archaeon]